MLALPALDVPVEVVSRVSVLARDQTLCVCVIWTTTRSWGMLVSRREPGRVIV